MMFYSHTGTNRQPHGRQTALILALALVVLCASACRHWILEDRRECPTWVTLRAEPALDETLWGNIKLNVTLKGEESWEKTVTARELNEGSILTLKPGVLTVSGLSGWPDEWRNSDSGLLLIPFGQQCPMAVGAFLEQTLEDEVEMYYFPLELRTLYANVFFDILGAEEGYEFKPVLRGGIDGYYFPSLMIHQGPFQCDADYRSYRHRYARIPRQADAILKAGPEQGSLITDFMFRFEGEHDWYTFYSMDLGKIVTDKGYDWTEAMLEDINISVSLANGALVRLAVSVADWTVIIIGDDGKIVI